MWDCFGDGWPSDFACQVKPFPDRLTKEVTVNVMTRETLNLFVEKAALMRRRAYWRFFEEGHEISFSFGVDATTGHYRDMTFMGQDEEARDALSVTLRLFIQDNDCISLRKMANLSTTDTGLSPSWKVGYDKLRAEINQLLDDPAESLGQEIGLPGLTRRQVLNTFLYGEIAHTDPCYRAQYRAWRGLSAFPLIEFVFASTVSSLLCTILNAAELAEAELVSTSAPP